jgi:hypothetical protein
MAWTTVANEVKKAALDGITPLFNSGTVRLLTSADAELAVPTFGATAFGAATTASPSVAAANAMTADSSITTGTIAKCELRTSGAAIRLAGSVGTSGTDLIMSDNVIPGSATSMNFSSFTLSLQLT